MLWIALDNSYLIYVHIFKFGSVFSFPDPRKNPVLYSKWCNILNIEPKKEKANKPLVCSVHFGPKDFDSLGNLEARAAPKRAWKKHLKSIKEYKTKRKLKSPEHYKFEVRTESYEEISIEGVKFADQVEQFEGDIQFLKDEPLDVNAAVMLNVKDLDQEFLESLLPNIRRMNEKQNKIFRRQMTNILCKRKNL